MIYLLKGSARQIHSPQPEISHRAHSEMFLTAAIQGRCGDIEGHADLLKIDWPVGIRLKPFRKAPHNLLVPMPSTSASLVPSFCEAHHGDGQRLLQRSQYFRVAKARLARTDHLDDYVMEVP